MLENYSDEETYFLIDSEFAVELLNACHEDELGQVPSKQFEYSIRNINRDHKAILIVRRDRSIAAGTGTLLSPNDRKLGSSFTNDTVLILYRVNGEISKGWQGAPFWIPNVKLPGKRVIYYKE